MKKKPKKWKQTLLAFIAGFLLATYRYTPAVPEETPKPFFQVYDSVVLNPNIEILDGRSETTYVYNLKDGPVAVDSISFLNGYGIMNQNGVFECDFDSDGVKDITARYFPLVTEHFSDSYELVTEGKWVLSANPDSSVEFSPGMIKLKKDDRTNIVLYLKERTVVTESKTIPGFYGDTPEFTVVALHDNGTTGNTIKHSSETYDWDLTSETRFFVTVDNPNGNMITEDNPNEKRIRLKKLSFRTASGEETVMFLRQSDDDIYKSEVFQTPNSDFYVTATYEVLAVAGKWVAPDEGEGSTAFHSMIYYGGTDEKEEQYFIDYTTFREKKPYYLISFLYCAAGGYLLIRRSKRLRRRISRRFGSDLPSVSEWIEDGMPKDNLKDEDELTGIRSPQNPLEEYEIDIRTGEMRLVSGQKPSEPERQPEEPEDLPEWEQRAGH